MGGFIGTRTVEVLRRFLVAPLDISCVIRAIGILIAASSFGASASPEASRREAGSRDIVAEFQAIATLHGELPVDSPWSPSDQRLAFRGNDGGVYVFDASRPREPATLVLPPDSDSIQGHYITWSPDGRWLACQTQAKRDVRAGLSSLIAREATGAGPIHVLVARQSIQRFTWAANGNVYYWNGTRHSVSPPEGSRPVRSSLPERPFLRMAPPVLSVFRVEPQEMERPLAALQTPNIGWVIPRDVFPCMRKYLVSIADNTRGVYSAVVDTAGTVLVDLGDEKGLHGSFTGTSVSAEGKYVVGFEEIDADEKIVSTWLYVADAGGAWRVQVEPAIQGFDPMFSHVEDLVTFQGQDIHVGRLRVSR